MLANGITLSYKTKSGSDYTVLTGLKEVPEIGSDKEKVDNTDLSANNKQYEYGTGDYGDLEYKFKYENKNANSPYRVLRQAADDNEVLSFREQLPDGTTYEYDAQVSVKLGGGSSNSPLEFTVKMAIQSDIEVKDPLGT